jgi:5'-nucleotidase
MKRLRRILLTNDDGLASPGLVGLALELARTGKYDLRVAAPEKEQSGAGHCITIHTPLYAEKVELDGALARVPTYRVAGTPADCVKLAVTNLFPESLPDLVVSGINRGPNVGVNVLYSGTVAAALEACINGVPAVALSLDIPPDGIWHFAQTAELSLAFIEAALREGLPPWTILNVNFPNRPGKDLRGVKLTRHGHSGFKEFYIEEQAEGPRRRFRLEGEMVYRDEDEESDAHAMRAGFISLTPLGLSLYEADLAARLAKWPLVGKAPG